MRSLRLDTQQDASQIGKEYKSFLTPEGEEIYEAILEHCKANKSSDEIQVFEMAMLSNSLAMYANAAEYCNENGVKMTFINEKTGGQYQQICPEYTVMKNEYANILKHAPKFGLNPADMAKLGMKKKKKANPNEGLD